MMVTAHVMGFPVEESMLFAAPWIAVGASVWWNARPAPLRHRRRRRRAHHRDH